MDATQAKRTNLQSWSEVLGHSTFQPQIDFVIVSPIHTPDTMLVLMHITKPQCLNIVLGTRGTQAMER